MSDSQDTSGQMSDAMIGGAIDAGSDGNVNLQTYDMTEKITSSTVANNSRSVTPDDIGKYADISEITNDETKIFKVQTTMTVKNAETTNADFAGSRINVETAEYSRKVC